MSATVVLKVGGDMLLDDHERVSLANNVRDLTESGARVVIVHGGGPQVNALQEKLGLVPRKVGGRRITSEADLSVVKSAICGEVNVDLTALLLSHGVRAFGMHGASARMIRAQRRPPTVVSGAGDAPIDFGLVGDVIDVNGILLERLLALELTPVIATLGIDDDGQVLNINADTTVAAVARSVAADLLLMITKVGGVYRDVNDESSRFATLNAVEIRQLIKDGVVVGGMIPKVEEAIATLEGGVKTVAIVSAQQHGSFVGALNGDHTLGTRLTLV